MLGLVARGALGVSVLGLFGCSGEPLATPLDENGGSAAVVGGGGSAGVAASGAAGQGGVSAGGASSTGGSVSCDTFPDATGYTLLIHIKNEMSQTLYLGPDAMTCGASALYEVEDGARTKLPPLLGCIASCQAVMSGAAAGCPTACSAPSTVALEPGQTIDLPWDGRFGVPQTIPSQCMKDPAQATSCTQAKKIEAGVFTFAARAGTKRECLLTGGCSCASNTNGGCTAPSSLIGGTIYTSEFLVALEPGELSPGGEPQYIGIVFR